MEPHERLVYLDAVENGIELIRNTDLRVVYQRGLENPINDQSAWFLRQALDNPNIDARTGDHTIGVNDGPLAGRTVHHLHTHIIPRYKGDMEDPRGGVRYVIPKMGNYKLPRK